MRKKELTRKRAAQMFRGGEDEMDGKVGASPTNEVSFGSDTDPEHGSAVLRKKGDDLYLFSGDGDVFTDKLELAGVYFLPDELAKFLSGNELLLDSMMIGDDRVVGQIRFADRPPVEIRIDLTGACYIEKS